MRAQRARMPMPGAGHDRLVSPWSRLAIVARAGHRHPRALGAHECSPRDSLVFLDSICKAPRRSILAALCMLGLSRSCVAGQIREGLIDELARTPLHHGASVERGDVDA